jgi:hypothetical protein
MKTMMIALALVAYCGAAQAATVRDAHVGCVTEAGYREWTQAALSNDMRQGQALKDSGECFSIQGMEYSIAENGFLRVRLRIYFGTSSILLYTAAEATR